MYASILQDKILQSTGRGRSVTVTNDGATILKSLHIDNPAAKVLIGILICYILLFSPSKQKNMLIYLIVLRSALLVR